MNQRIAVVVLNQQTMSVGPDAILFWLWLRQSSPNHGGVELGIKNASFSVFSRVFCVYNENRL